MLTESELHPTSKEELYERVAWVRKRPNPNVDPTILENVLSLEEKITRLSFLMEEGEQEDFVRLYVKHITGVNMEKDHWGEEVGLRMNGGGEKPPIDGVTFYRELFNTIPAAFTEEEINWLTQHDQTAGGAFNLLCYMSFWMPRSHLVCTVMDYIHAYK